MTFKSVLLASASAAALSGAAYAADFPSKKPAVAFTAPLVFTWTGVYVGASVATATLSTD